MLLGGGPLRASLTLFLVRARSCPAIATSPSRWWHSRWWRSRSRARTRSAGSRPQRHLGPSGLVSQGEVFDWIDRTVGPDAVGDAGARIRPSGPSTSRASPAVGHRVLEPSVVRAPHHPASSVARPARSRSSIPIRPRDRSREHVAARATSRRATKETRFRVSGKAVSSRAASLLIDAERPWRTDWLTFGLYDDGWTSRRAPARIRVFAYPHQQGARTRYLAVGVRRRSRRRWCVGAVRGRVERRRVERRGERHRPGRALGLGVRPGGRVRRRPRRHLRPRLQRLRRRPQPEGRCGSSPRSHSPTRSGLLVL